MENKILLEEINRIKLISNYDLNKTSIENQKIIFERNMSREFRAFLETTRGTEVLRSELETILKQGGIEIKTLKDPLGGVRTLTKPSEILKAFKEGKLAESSVVDLKTAMFKNSNSSELIKALSNDFVNSEKFIAEYSHLSNAEIVNKLNKGPMKLPKNSEQSRAIINAHEAKLAKDAKAAEEARKAEELRKRKESKKPEEQRTPNPKEEPKPYESEREWKNTEKMTEEERIIEVKKRMPKEKRVKMIKEDPKGFFKFLKKSGLVIWKAGGWVLSNIVWLALFGGLAYGVWQLWSKLTGVKKECPPGMTEDPQTGECVKGGESEDDDNNTEDNRIKDEQGNSYDPCSGVFKIWCVTKDGINENGTDYISQAQDCLGLSPTGMFNKEMEDKLYKKINKRTFTKADMNLICMRRSTLAAL